VARTGRGSDRCCQTSGAYLPREIHFDPQRKFCLVKRREAAGDGNDNYRLAEKWHVAAARMAAEHPDNHMDVHSHDGAQVETRSEVAI